MDAIDHLVAGIQKYCGFLPIDAFWTVSASQFISQTRDKKHGQRLQFSYKDTAHDLITAPLSDLRNANSRRRRSETGPNPKYFDGVITGMAHPVPDFIRSDSRAACNRGWSHPELTSQTYVVKAVSSSLPWSTLRLLRPVGVVLNSNRETT